MLPKSINVIARPRNPGDPGARTDSEEDHHEDKKAAGLRLYTRNGKWKSNP